MGAKNEGYSYTMGIGKKDLVSVVIPAFNASSFLSETIESVLSQSYAKFELIIVDDGSTDNTRGIVNNWMDKDARIKYEFQINAGVSVARNKGVEVSEGNYLAFLDADDIWDPTNLKKKIQTLESSPNCRLVHSDIYMIDENSQPTGKTLSGKEGEVLNDLLLWDSCVIPPPSSILIRRSVIDSIGGFDVNLSNNADQEFYFRVANFTCISRIDEPLVGYRIHSNNMHTNIQLLERDSIYAYKKARDNNLFSSSAFKNKCYSNMYLILAANFHGHKRSYLKALQYLLLGVFVYPPSIFKLIKRLFR